KLWFWSNCWRKGPSSSCTFEYRNVESGEFFGSVTAFVAHAGRERIANKPVVAAAAAEPRKCLRDLFRIARPPGPAYEFAELQTLREGPRPPRKRLRHP